MQVAFDRSLLNGMTLWKNFDSGGAKAVAALADEPISRFDMAEGILSMTSYLHINQFSSAAIVRARASIADYGSIPSTHRVAVDFAYAYGYLTGIDSRGTFAGDSGMTRAQAAVVLIRLDELNEAGIVSGANLLKPPAFSGDMTQGYWLLYDPNPDRMEIYRFYEDGTFEYRLPGLSLSKGHYETHDGKLHIYSDGSDSEYTYDATQQGWIRYTTRFGNVNWTEILVNCSTCNDFFMASEWLQENGGNNKEGYDGVSRTSPCSSVIDYIGLTVNDVEHLLGSDFQYADYWFLGAAKQIYYTDFPVTLYFNDLGWTGKAAGEEKIIIVDCALDCVERACNITEIAPNIPLRINTAQLTELGYTVSDARNEDEFGDIPVFCIEFAPQIEIYFFWYNHTDPNIDPADMVLIWDKST